MALILVAEKESRYIERIHDALTPEGWQVRVVGNRREALAAAAAEPPQLIVVSSEIDGAGDLLRTFARRTGGPGAVALVPEQSGDVGAVERAADELIAKPFTDQDLRLAVRRGLAAASQAPGGVPDPPGGEGKQLTAAEIFGDMVAELESEIATAEDVARDPSVPLSPEPVSPESPTPAVEAPAVEPPQPAAPARVRSSRDIDRVLEETLSGLERHVGRRPEARRPSVIEGAEVDALLSETLSGMNLSRRRPKSPPAAETPAAPRPRSRRLGEIDLSEIEEMVRPRAKVPRPAAPEAPAAPSAAAEGSPVAPAEPLKTADRPPAAPHPPETPSGPVVGSETTFEADEEASALDLDLDFDLEEIPEVSVEAEGEEAPPEMPAGPAMEENDRPAAEPATPPATKGWPGGEEQQFGQYTLLERIAVGGMAEVWKARMTGLEGFQKTVAIKKILPHLTGTEDFVEMFVDEAKLAAQLNHPNIIHIYDLGKIGDRFYIAMEYVAGPNLRAVLNDSRNKGLPIPLGVALLIAARLASALDYAHRKKDFEGQELALVHRDVSPQNVLLSHDGDIKLCDFGIVKAVSKASQTQMGALKGKLQYMSPEQAWGKSVDARSDIFSLGALLYEMLAGQRLFAGDNELSVLEAVRQCSIRSPRELNPHIPEEVEGVVLHALERDPDSRIQNAGLMQKDLEKILYSLRPTPSQADLTDYLQRLRVAPEVGPGMREEAAGAPQAAPAVEPPTPSEAAAPITSPEPPEPAVAPGPEASAEPARPVEATAPDDQPVPVEVAAVTSGGKPGAAGRKAAAAVEAIPPAGEGEVEVEEGGSGGKKLLLVVIVILVLASAAVAVYLWTQRSRPAAEPLPPAVPETTAPADEDTAGTLGEEGSEGDGGEIREPRDEGEGGAGGETGSGETDPGSAPGQAVSEPPLQAEPSSSPSRTAASASSPERGQTTSAAAPAPRQPPPAPRRSEAREPPPPAQAEPRRAVSDLPPRAAPPAAVVPSATPAAATPATATPAASRPEAGRREVASAADELDPPAAETDDIETTAAETVAADPGPRTTPATTARDVVPQPSPQGRGSAGTPPVEPAAPDRAGAASRPTPSPARPSPANPPRTAEAKPPPVEPARPEVREGDLVGPGPGVVPPVLVSFDKPKYPPLAKRMRVEGDVVLSLLVDETGRVADVRLTQGVRQKVGINEAALEAARTARYQPATRDGVRVKMWTVLRIPFRL